MSSDLVILTSFKQSEDPKIASARLVRRLCSNDEGWRF